MKTCNKCGEVKGLDLFHVSSNNKKDGRLNSCKDCTNAYLAEQYANDPTRWKEANARWEAKNPEKVSAKVQRRNQRLKEAEGKVLSPKDKKAIKDFYGKCLACDSTEELTTDHVLPIFLGGTNLLDNIQVLCKSCNSSKGRYGTTDYRNGIIYSTMDA